MQRTDLAQALHELYGDQVDRFLQSDLTTPNPAGTVYRKDDQIWFSSFVEGTHVRLDEGISPSFAAVDYSKMVAWHRFLQGFRLVPGKLPSDPKFRYLSTPAGLRLSEQVLTIETNRDVPALLRKFASDAFATVSALKKEDVDGEARIALSQGEDGAFEVWAVDVSPRPFDAFVVRDGATDRCIVCVCSGSPADGAFGLTTIASGDLRGIVADLRSGKPWEPDAGIDLLSGRSRKDGTQMSSAIGVAASFMEAAKRTGSHLSGERTSGSVEIMSLIDLHAAIDHPDPSF